MVEVLVLVKLVGDEGLGRRFLNGTLRTENRFWTLWLSYVLPLQHGDQALRDSFEVVDV